MDNGRPHSNPDRWSDLPRMRRRVNVIYFLGTQDQSAIKIGRTDRTISERIEEHAGRGPLRDANRLVYLAAVPGINSDETATQRHFKSHLLDGEKEWFHAVPEIEGYIRWLRMQWFTLRTLDEADKDDVARSYEGIDGTIWLPDENRFVEDSAVSMTLDSLDDWGHVLDVDPPITGDDFYTDKRIINAARRAMGGIDLDPATHPAANRKYIRAKTIYTLTTNGLDQQWRGRVWCNPPFGNWKEWTKKIVREWNAGQIEAMCVLLATRTLTASGAAGLFENSNAFCITKGRIPFWGPKAGAPDDGHAIFYFGPDVAKFHESFGGIGHTAVPANSPRLYLTGFKALTHHNIGALKELDV